MKRARFGFFAADPILSEPCYPRVDHAEHGKPTPKLTAPGRLHKEANGNGDVGTLKAGTARVTQDLEELEDLGRRRAGAHRVPLDLADGAGAAQERRARRGDRPR